MKPVVKILGNYLAVTKTLAMQIIADEVAEWVTATEDLDDVSEGDRYFYHEDELYTEDDDVGTLLELAGYKVEWRDDLEDYDTSDTPYYDARDRQWMI